MPRMMTTSPTRSLAVQPLLAASPVHHGLSPDHAPPIDSASGRSDDRIGKRLFPPIDPAVECGHGRRHVR